MSPRPPGEATALLALLLLHDSRRPARLNDQGDLIILEEQDRSLWNQDQIAEALPLVSAAFRDAVGPFAIQAAIAAAHCRAREPEETDWSEIVGLYSLLERIQPSPIVSLNRAVAVAMVDGPEAALKIIDTLSDDLAEYHLLHAARADLLRRLKSYEAAAQDYSRALELVTNDSERRFLERRLAEVRSR
jgi:RNA polymerase sigma-70 factor (ECF subfamily)